MWCSAANSSASTAVFTICFVAVKVENHFQFLCGYFAILDAHVPRFSMHKDCRCNFSLNSHARGCVSRICLLNFNFCRQFCRCWQSATTCFRPEQRRKPSKHLGKHYVLACVVCLAASFYFSFSQAWAGVEAGVMRGMAVHALLLAKRAAGSKSLSQI